MTSFNYPMLLAPRFDPKIWGGRRLESVLGKQLPTSELFGESLESDGSSRVVNGEFTGVTIQELLSQNAEALLGPMGLVASGDFGDFPLLAKFIDASDVLSVQVHPNDEEAVPHGKRGKTEAWHVIHADPGAKLITGLKPGLSTAEIAQAIDDVTLGDLVIEQAVASGDTLLIPAGTTHAIGAGILLYEIQEASDVTYRMYDWGRVDETGSPRDLHVRESLEVVKPALRADRVAPLHTGPERWVLTACRFFALERWDFSSVAMDVPLDGRSFKLISAIGGAARITAGGETVSLPTGQTALVPASVPSVTIEGIATLLVSYVPDLETDIIAPLRLAGHSDEDIARLGGMLGHLETGQIP
jgi:mannose-6-phosphate isomerase